MQLHNLLVVVVVSDVSDVKVMSSTVAVIFAITSVVSKYNSESNLVFLTEPNQTHSEPNTSIFSKKNEPRFKNLFRTDKGCVMSVING